ncbi:MAG: helix-turn-helix transcriptional regulator [Arcobacteraceae bacterium]
MKLHEIGSKIKELRKEQNLTQIELAKKCGISRVTLGKLERDEVANISLKTLDILLNTLGYEIDFTRKNNFGLLSLDQLG